MKKIILFVVVSITLLLFMYNTNSKSESIKIGFVAGLSGKYSSLGTNVKNGVLLALDEVDYKIGDTKIEFIQKDDKQDSHEAKKAINDLINNDVKIIIGNTTSSMSKTSINIVNKYKDVLLFSPTSGSNEFSQKKDNFIRTQVANNTQRFKHTVDYFKRNKIKNIVAVYDENNLAYSKDFIDNLEKAFVNKKEKKFITSLKMGDPFKSIKDKIQNKNVDLIVIVANSIDSAKLIQYLKINGIKTPIMGSAWARSQDFIEEGGKAVEGVLFASSYDNASKSRKFLSFSKSFEKKYNMKPSVFSMQAYETTKIVLNMLKTDKNPQNLKNNILRKKLHEGLQGDIIFDQFGDVSREFYMVRIKNSKYQRID